MSFAIFALIFLLVFLALAKYRGVLSVAGAFVLIYGLTTMFLFYGLSSFGSGDSFLLMGTDISRMSFYHLTGAWYAGNLVTSLLIIRNYRRYLEVNCKA